jgi:hypothetical protein
MLRESREYERKPLLPPEEEGVFFIEVNGERHLFDNVRDVSVSGAGVQLPVALIPTSPVVLGFEREDHEVRVQATVVWCQELEPESAIDGHQPQYRLGIRFNPMDLKNSSALFLALREYIDPFGAY